MLRKGMSKSEIEEVLSDKGAFVKINYLNRFLQEDISLDMKKYCYLKLADIYESMNMFKDVGKMFDNVAHISILFIDKIKFHVEEAKAYIKGGLFSIADEAVKKSFAEANSTQRNEIYIEIKHFYKERAKKLESEGKKNSAVKIYEKMASMKISEIEKDEIKNKLLELYDKLGKVKEYNLLRGFKGKNC